MTVERALAEKGISVEVYDYPLMRKETEVVIDTSKHDESIRADEKAKVLEEFKARLIEEMNKGFALTLALADEIIEDFKEQK